MTTFARLSPSPLTTTTSHPVGPPPSSGSPATPPPGAVPGAGAPIPQVPLTGISSSLVVDLTEAARLVGRAVEMLDTVPPDDVGSEATKDLRIRIFRTNAAAQSRLERQLDAGNPDRVLSELRRADAYLEDANWQLARKPSPDGRFDGVDIPGAVRDTREGARVLDELLRAAGAAPTTPAVPPPGAPPHPPSAPPTAPTSPGVPQRPPTAPPTAPPGSPDSGGDYPGEDEFPTDDKILGGGDS